MDPHERTAPAGRSEQEILIAAGEEPIAGTLVMPSDATALVLFAHGSGSSRFSPRNIAVATSSTYRASPHCSWTS